LSDLELYRPDHALATAPSLWNYCTAEWLTLRAPNGDSNRSRWPLDPRWEVLQAASLSHGGTELPKIHRRKRATSLRVLMPALIGYLARFAQLAGTTDIDDTLAALAVSIANDESARRMTFAERVRQRRAEVEYR